MNTGTCNVCKKNAAKFFFRCYIGSQSFEYFLCESCMKERGEKPLGLAVGPLGNEIVFEESGISQFTADQLKTVEELKCPSCGTDHHEVSVNGLFGCEQCYSTFSHLLEIAEEQIDDSIKRKGDLQGTFNDTVAIGKIEVLKRQMDYAVQTENYERAAIFRDQIEELSKKMGEDE